MGGTNGEYVIRELVNIAEIEHAIVLLLLVQAHAKVAVMTMATVKMV